MVTVADKLVDVLKKVVAKPKAKEYPEPVRFMGMTYQIVSREDWTAIAPHPRQRDTELRAPKSRHLHTFKNSHANVSVVRLLSDDGEIIKEAKVDAHTRCYIWQRGMLLTGQAPEAVYVTTHEVYSEDEFENLYYTFDALDAVERNHEKIQGYMNNYGLQLYTAWLRLGRYGSAVSMASKGLVPSNDKEAQVKLFGQELLAIDALGTHQRMWTRGITAAALVTLADNPEAIGFWRLYDEGVFVEPTNSCDGDAVWALHETIRAFGDMKRQGHLVAGDIATIACYLCNSWLTGGKRKFVSAVTSCERSFPYYQPVKELKRRLKEA
jgi:hypothetical protein